MRRKKKTRFMRDLLLLVENYWNEIEINGHIYLELKSVKEYFGLEYMDDTYFVRILNENFKIIELDGNRFKCGFIDNGNGIYIKNRDKKMEKEDLVKYILKEKN